MKKIRRWQGGMDAVQTAQYLHDMAANGWILDEVGYLLFVFREEEPQELSYLVVTMKESPSGVELAKYEAEGWKKAGNWEEKYIFVKERDIFADDSVERQMMTEELDRQLEKDRVERKTFAILLLIIIAFFGAFLFKANGTEMFTNGLGASLLVNFGPNLFFVVFGGWLVSRRLRKRKAQMQDGEPIPEKAVDWRRSRFRAAAGVITGVLLIGWAIYLEMGWNEKIYDLPQEIDYVEVPAVRLENLENGEFIRIGEDVKTQKADVLDMYGPAFLGWHSYDNAVREHGMLLIMKETETEQLMRLKDGNAEIELSTDYCDFLFEFMAKKQYKENLEWEDDIFEGDHRWDARVVQEMDAFDEIHICKKKFTGEAILHILCRQGRQVMELDYTGQAEPERILEEIEKVFEAQR